MGEPADSRLQVVKRIGREVAIVCGEPIWLFRMSPKKSNCGG